MSISKPVRFFENPWVLLGVILLATFAVYLQVIHFDYVNFDDGAYITENRHVQMGITFESVRWAFQSLYHSNWFPLSWLSHMLVYHFFGIHPGPHHAVNLIFHLLNTAFLFLLLWRLTGSVKKTAMVTALFALHPLHVESVAWITERKDVLSTFFALLSGLAYCRYAKNGSKPALNGAYGQVILFFALALMSKPMPVTLPVIFLLLDYWPLERTSRVSLRELFIEKVPLFIMSAASSGVTIVAQRLGGSVPVLEQLPADVRIQNAILSYARYLKKMVYPFDLGVYYPYTKETIFIGKVIAAVFVLLLISLVVIQHARRYRYLVTGWLWYLIMLLPVIGFLQVGGQSLADRYTYLPLTGVFIMIVWGVPDLLKGWSGAKTLLTALAIAGIIFLAMICSRQVSYWKNTGTLFSHTLEVTKRNALAHGILAEYYSSKGKLEEAADQYERANAIQPQPDMLNNLGNAYFLMGRVEDAMRVYAEAVQRDPNQPVALTNLGIMLAEKKRFKEAEGFYSRAVSVAPDYEAAYTAWAETLLRQGLFHGAWNKIETALLKNPENPVAFYFLGILHLQSKTFKEMPRLPEVPSPDADYTDPAKEFEETFLYKGDFESAFECFKKALERNPRFYLASIQWGVALSVMGRYEEAQKRFEEVLEYQPNNGLLYGHLGRLQAMQGKNELALEYYQKALGLKTDFPRTHKRMGDLYLAMNRKENAKEHYEEALYLLPSYAQAKEALESMNLPA
jgi:protein O-mannosyl-transferase